MALSEYTILVADYIPTDMLLFKILLEQAHCRLLTTTHSCNILQKARESRPDLILLDIRMPGLDGFEVAAILQAEEATRNIPILYVVNTGDYPIFMPDGRALSDKEYREKPFGMQQLVKRILQKLEKE